MSVDRINISNNALDRAMQSYGAPEMRRGTDAQPAPQPGADEVSLSDTAKNVDRLSQNIEHSSAERLEEVRKALTAGTYRVSGKAIAEKMIDLNSR